MSRRKLNQFQKSATEPGISARVMANAGAGKTFVLTARVLRLLLKGTHPGKILCLTYTKAAAAEMSERINSQLQKWVLMDDADLSAELAELIEESPSAEQLKIAKRLFSLTLESAPPPRIQTIHSFCQEVLKRFPLESGVQPYFEVVDNITSNELIKETTLRLLSKSQLPNEVTAAIDYIAENSGEWKFGEVTGEIIQQRNRIRDLFELAGDPAQIIEMLYKKHNISPQISSAELIAAFLDFHPERRSEVEKLAYAMQNSTGVTDIKLGNQLAEGLKRNDFNLYKGVFMTLEEKPRAKVITAGGRKHFPEPDEVIAYEQEQLVELVDKLNTIENLRFTSHVLYLAYGLVEAYEAIKKSRAVVDYNDLIYYTKKLLTSASAAAWVLYKLDGGIEHILIDEAQDTSPEQWQIILALVDEFLAGEGAAKRDRTVFIVGDEKQSIYSFQGADKRAFNEVTEIIRARCFAAKKEFRDIELNTSFRSVEAVLKLADSAFEAAELRDSISSTGRAISHELSRKGEGGRVEIWPVLKNEEKQKLEEWQLPLGYFSTKSADLLLAEKIATTIGEWLESGRKLASTCRAVQPSDILILLRSRGEMADMLIRKLKARGIAVSGSDRLKLTEHIAVQDLISLANFLLLPGDDLSLAEVLKSPLFGISEEDLFELSYNRKPLSIWEKLKANPRFDAIYRELSELLNRVDFDSVYELFSRVLDQNGGRKKLISRLGAEVNDVLDEFLELSVNFERSHTNSMQQFIHWIGVSNMEIKRDMEQAKNHSGGEVRIMTVHGAKGLEAPIVFLADAAKKPTPKRQLVWDDEFFYSYKTKEKLGAGLRAAVDVAEMADYEEYLRLLYVAITRARDELYVAGALGDKAKVDGTWYEIIANALEGFGVVNDGVTSYETPHLKEVVLKPAAMLAAKVALPEFAVRKLPPEHSEIEDFRDIEVSDNIAQISRGKRIHKVLEIINEIPAALRGQYLNSIFAGEPEVAEMVARIINAPEFAEIFGKNARAEVPIIGIVGGKTINARLDRLVEKGGEMHIIDFKTSANPPAVMPEKYKEQMLSYRALVAARYPGRTIRSFILWISTAKLIEVA